MVKSKLSALLAVVVATIAAFSAHAREAVTYLDYVESKGHNAATASLVLLDDVVVKASWKIMVDFSSDYTGTFVVICSKKFELSGDTARNICIDNINGSGWRVDVAGAKGTAVNGGLSNLGAVAGLRQSVVYSAGKLYLDGTMILDRSAHVASDTVDRSSDLVIFGDKTKDPAGYTNYTEGRIYRVKIWDESGTLLHDLRPAMNASGVAGLYDSSADKFYASAIATAFTAGPLAAPEGVEFLEYVETKDYTSGAGNGQFFNTEYAPTSYSCRVEMDVTPLFDPSKKNGTFFRSTTADTEDVNYLTLFSITGKGLRLDMGSTQTFTNAPLKGVRRTYVYDAGVLSIDGETLIDNSSLISTFTKAPDMPFTIGGSYNIGHNPASTNATVQNFGGLRIYRVRIWDAGGTLARDFRPAKDAAGNPALYDVVNRKFHYHGYRPLTAAGAETYGALAGYGEVCAGAPVGYNPQYIQTSQGKQWYDTGYIPTGLAKVEMTAAPLNSYSATYAWFAANDKGSGDGGNKLCVFYIGSTTKALRLDVNGDRTSGVTTAQPTYNVVNTVLLNGGKLYLNESLATDQSEAAAAMGSAGWHMMLLANSNGRTSPKINNAANMRVYGVKIWDRDGGKLVRDYVPARNAAGYVALYDKVEEKFCANTNGVSAAAGPDNMPTAAQIEAAGDVLASAVLSKTGSKIAAGGFAQKVEGDVACPFADVTKRARCAYFPQSFAVVADGEGTNVVTATTGLVSLGKPFSSAEGTSWTAVLRVRREAKGIDVEDTVLSLGSDCAKDGFKIGFCGSEANRRLDMRVGNASMPELSGFFAPAGDWLDIAVTVDKSDNSVRVYYCREGHSVIWAERKFAAYASVANLAARSTWEAKVGGEASVSNREVGRMVDGKWTMFDDALKAFRGSVEGVALWSRKLSDAEVLAAFKKSLPQIPGMTLIVR